MIYVKNISNWPDPGGQKTDMTQNCSLLQQKGNFPGKYKNNETTQVCLKYNLSTSLLSTLTTYVKTSKVGLIQGVKKWMTQNRSLLQHKGNFPRKSKNNETTQICLKYNLSTSLLSTFDICQNISSWPDPGGQKMDMTQIGSLLWHKGNFPGKSENNETTQICLKYSLRCAGASILERYLKNNRLSPIK